MRYRHIQKPRHISFESFFLLIWTLHTYSRSQIPLNCKNPTRNGQVIAQKSLFSPVQRAKPNFWKNWPREVDRRAMPIGKMVLFVILPFGNPKRQRTSQTSPTMTRPFVKWPICTLWFDMKWYFVSKTVLNYCGKKFELTKKSNVFLSFTKKIKNICGFTF